MNRPSRTKPTRPRETSTEKPSILDRFKRSLLFRAKVPPHQRLQDGRSAEPSLRGFELFEQRLALSASLGVSAAQEFWEVFADVCHPSESTGNAPIPSNAPVSDLTNELVFQPGVLQSDEFGSNPLGASQTSPLSASPITSLASNRLQTSSLLAQAEVIRDDYEWSGRGQTVAIIDSGVAWDHQALGEGFGPGNRIVGGWDFAENDANPYDDGPIGYHGTHVTGLIAGDSDTLQGVAPGADVVALRVFDDFGRGSLDWIESALRWVYDHRDSFDSPITTVNLSLGTNVPEHLWSTFTAQFEDEFQLLHESDIMVVAAAGNRFTTTDADTIAYPAASQWVVAVGSNRSDGGLSSFSQRDDGILTTVGENLQSSVPEHVLGWDGVINDYQAASGTSMAAPQVAGATMVIREAADSLGIEMGSQEILALLNETSVPQTDPVTGFEYRPVNLIGAIESLLANVATDHQDPSDDASDSGTLPKSTYDLGTVTWGTTTLSVDAETWVTPERTGVFSLHRVDTFESSAPLQVRDLDGNLLWSGNLANEMQLDLTVQAGKSIVITTDSMQDVELQFANILSHREGKLDLSLGELSIPIEVSLAEGLRLSAGVFDYDLSSERIATAILDGGVGADQLTLTGSSGAGRLTLNPYEDGSWKEGSIDFVLRGFEQVTYDGHGGNDRVFIYDTQGDDRLTASPGNATLEGVGFRYDVSNVARSYVHATAGGQDVAFLYDSPEDDQLAVRPQFVSLRGGEYFNNALGFERVYAYATRGGNDTADIYDSIGDDRLTASSASAMISGPGYYVQAKAFDSVSANATAGGSDLATLYSDGSNDQRWIRTNDQITLRSEGLGERTARGFERIELYSAGQVIHPESIGVSASVADNESLLRTFYQRLLAEERNAMNSLFASLDPDSQIP